MTSGFGIVKIRAPKTEMSSFHPVILRIIGINSTKIPDIHSTIDEANRKLFSRTLSELVEPLTAKLINKRSLRSKNSGIKPNHDRTSAYESSFVQKYLRADM